MRKAQKQEILNVIKNLYEAHQEIKETLNRRNWALLQNMLSECQEFAVALGESIEGLEGEGHITVSYLEGYCEALYDIYEDINNNQISENKINKILKKKLLMIENSVKNDISVRKEVVFFPYKASMWDSLESIYLAAKEDPLCDAYCVPIPYFDLQADQSYGQMHYEGAEYPSDIIITDWQAYNFEERKPDEIYIHNAYDDCNLVTSVHPRFYSRNLKKYTDKLIYVPYFVLGEINLDDKNAVDRMKHFCFLPGIINADKVIVESEDVKKLYVNEYLKAAKANGFTGYHIEKKYLEKKIQGTGSPKYNKVLVTKKEGVDIPKEWLHIIEKPDGNWKKIILCNTGIKTLLENERKALERLEKSLSIFEDKKEEIALIWRPHPLLESTLKAMRPMLLKEYMDIVDKYKSAGWGIYDDTADMNRAIALSDAYYGDSSSVVQLYKQINKPIMVTDYSDS